MTTPAEIPANIPGLKVFSDELETRLCLQVASDHLVYRESSAPSARSSAEVIEIAEATFGGKFSLPVSITGDHPLSPASGRTVSRSSGPLATIEVWSLSPGSYDLVLRLPAATRQHNELLAHITSQFIDQGREISRVIDNLDLLRFQAGPSLSLLDAQQRLIQLERHSGTRLDVEGLLTLLASAPRKPLPPE